MKLSIVLSTHAARFEAVAFKGDFEVNVNKVAGYGYGGFVSGEFMPHPDADSSAKRAIKYLQSLGVTQHSRS